jgi:hypothetical protein
MNHTPSSHHHNPGWYEIRIDGHLDGRWAAWFDAMSLTTASDGTTIIRCHVADQAALHGVLQRVRDLGLPLVSVTQINPDQPLAATERPRQLTMNETHHEGD